MDQSCIHVEAVSLNYPIYGSNARSFKSTFLNVATGGKLDKSHGKMIVEALKDLNFTLEKGDRLALLGHNGAGKSTLLKVLAKIYEPTAGRVHVSGRINCLFDIMMGMDEELNGYENVILRGLILGLSKEEIQKITPQIEEFAELGDFMKMPIKTYSSGMKVRLAFGIITHVFSEVLLIDEIVNVGDAAFFEKAKARMLQLIDRSEVLVLSTHDTRIVKELCNKALILNAGRMEYLGSVEGGLERLSRGFLNNSD